MTMSPRTAPRFDSPLIARILSVLLLVFCLASGSAFADQNKKKGNPYPHRDDPSQFTGPIIGNLPEDLPDANLGSFEGGETGTPEDAGTTNSLPEDFQRSDGRFKGYA